MANQVQEQPFERECAWTGESTPGRHYVLTTTEGQELVSERAFRAGGADPDAVATLQRDLAHLAKRVTELERGAGQVPAQRGAAATKKGR